MAFLNGGQLLDSRDDLEMKREESSAWSVASKYFAKLDGKAATDD